jgi:putative transposase
MTWRKIVLTEFGGPDRLEMQTVDALPEPQGAEVRVRVLVTSAAFTDVMMCQHRSTQRKVPRARADEVALTAAIVALATRYGRYGYRRITGMLRDGWAANSKRVERIWRREGLKVPQNQPKRSRLGLSDGSCIRLRPEYPNHAWSYDFVEDRTHDGNPACST